MKGNANLYNGKAPKPRSPHVHAQLWDWAPVCLQLSNQHDNEDEYTHKLKWVS